MIRVSFQKSLMYNYSRILEFRIKHFFSPNQQKNPSYFSFFSPNKFQKSSQHHIYSKLKSAGTKWAVGSFLYSVTINHKWGDSCMFPTFMLYTEIWIPQQPIKKRVKHEKKIFPKKNLFWHFTVRINCSRDLKSSASAFILEFAKVFLYHRTIFSHNRSQQFLKQSNISVSLGRVLELEKISLFVSKEMWGQLHVPFLRPCY